MGSRFKEFTGGSMANVTFESGHAGGPEKSVLAQAAGISIYPVVTGPAVPQP